MKLRQFLSIFFLFFWITTPAYAAHPDTGPGCGLGKLAWGDYPNQQAVGPQIAMATTNTTLGSQTFGISSGTSGCTNHEEFVHEKAAMFTTTTFDTLVQEIAQGGGEHLTSLAILIGVPTEHQQQFFLLAKSKLPSLINSHHPSPQVILQTFYHSLDNLYVLAKENTSLLE